jgi:hypothetical protein
MGDLDLLAERLADRSIVSPHPPEPSLPVVLRAVAARTSLPAGVPPARERRAAPRRAIDHLGIVVQIQARRRLRRIWRPGVSAAVVIIDVATPPERPIRLTGRDLRTGCFVIMDVDDSDDRVTVIGIRPPGTSRMRPVGRRFRALEPGILPPMLQRVSWFAAPLPGRGPWELPKRVAPVRLTLPDADLAPPTMLRPIPAPALGRAPSANAPVDAARASAPSTYLGLVARRSETSWPQAKPRLVG